MASLSPCGRYGTRFGLSRLERRVTTRLYKARYGLLGRATCGTRAQHFSFLQIHRLNDAALSKERNGHADDLLKPLGEQLRTVGLVLDLLDGKRKIALHRDKIVRIFKFKNDGAGIVVIAQYHIGPPVAALAVRLDFHVGDARKDARHDAVIKRFFLVVIADRRNKQVVDVLCDFWRIAVP